MRRTLLNSALVFSAVVALLSLFVGDGVVAQVATQTAFNEGTTQSWPIDFRLLDGTPAAPSAATYKIVTFKGNLLVPVSAIPNLAAHVDLVVPGLSIPLVELNSRNHNLPEQIPAAIVVTSTLPGGQTAENMMWFSLNNVPSI
jgi:hypothetical protein